MLRFWETKFPFVTPVKRAGGRRFYRPQDVVILKAIRRLLHDEGLTIKGVQRLHKEQGLSALAAYGEPGTAFTLDATSASPPSDAKSAPVSLTGSTSDRLRALLVDIEAAQSRLDAVLAD